jgi:hypothetical protein
MLKRLAHYGLSRSEKPDRFKKIVYLWYNFKTCQVYFQEYITGNTILLNGAGAMASPP